MADAENVIKDPASPQRFGENGFLIRARNATLLFASITPKSPRKPGAFTLRKKCQCIHFSSCIFYIYKIKYIKRESINQKTVASAKSS